MNTVNEVSKLADWLDNHARHLERMELIGAMPESELTPRIARAAELLRQLTPAPADEVPAPPCCEPEQATMAAARAAAEAEASAIKLQQLAPQNPLGVADPTIARAAELLRQLAPVSAPADEGAPISLYEPRHSPQPAILAAPSSERPWERPGWCNEAGQCWMGNPGGNGFSQTWRLAKVNNYQAADLWQLSGFLWSLPHWAIPIIPSTANPAP